MSTEPRPLVRILGERESFLARSLHHELIARFHYACATEEEIKGRPRQQAIAKAQGDEALRISESLRSFAEAPAES